MLHREFTLKFNDLSCLYFLQIFHYPFEQPFTTVNATVKLTELQKHILSLMKEDSEITVTNMSKALEVNYTTVTINISKLKENGLVKRQGSDKKGIKLG